MNKLGLGTAKLIPLALLLTTSLGIPCSAARMMIVPGEQAQQQTAKLTQDIHWFKNLNAAQSEARKEGKMVFWMHMLGQIDGTT